MRCGVDDVLAIIIETIISGLAGRVLRRRRARQAVKMTIIALYFVRRIVLILLNSGLTISVYDLVKFINHNSRTLNEIK